jgi:16S rRNA (guanine(966)-N(2))-methyltransferase RsmD
MRIIAGEFRGRRLKTLAGRAVRPTSDRLRETLFNVLGAAVAGSTFIDCYAGSGAVGLEAASRGAAMVFLIEESPAAIRIIEQNIATLAIYEHAKTIHARVNQALHRLAEQGVHAEFCFLDPPYSALQDCARNMKGLARSTLMRRDGLMILEHSRKDDSPELASGWVRVRLLQQGSSALSFYRKP